MSGWAGSPQRSEDLLTAAGIDPKTRGEALTVADFQRLAAVAVGDGGASNGDAAAPAPPAEDPSP